VSAVWHPTPKAASESIINKQIFFVTLPILLIEQSYLPFEQATCQFIFDQL
jgi:hypothetical protein